MDRIEEQILDAIGRLGFATEACFAVRLALEEALLNAFVHGHRSLPDSTPVRVCYDARPDELTITVEDQGHGFDPDDVPDPTTDDNLERPTGRGVLLMRAYMSEVRFNDRGNRVTLIYRPKRDHGGDRG